MCKLVLRRSKCSSSKECLYQLHWLPVQQRIDYKILTLTHKCIQGQAPKYLQDLIAIKQKSDRNLRLNDAGLILNQPHIRHKTFASWSFKYATPYLWKWLPKHVRDMEELPKFKKTTQNSPFKDSICRAQHKVMLLVKPSRKWHPCVILCSAILS